MANHWLTNRGKYLLATGAVVGASDLYMGLIEGASVPAAMDSEAEIQDLNFVSELLALTGVDEPTASGYSRQVLSTITGTEDDTNNRVNIDADNETFASVATGDEIIAGFIAKEGGSDAQDQLISVFTLDAAIPTNGSNIGATISDLYRLT